MNPVEWVCTDALPWLADRQGQCGAVITSPPDANELGVSLEEYTPWLEGAMRLCLGAATPGEPCIFYVTDRLADGRWLSKPGFLERMATERTMPLLWHKVVLRRAPGVIDLHRPTYAHLLCFGYGRPGMRTPDVIPASRALYSNGTPLLAVAAAVHHVQLVGGTRVTDPFCGKGAIPLAAARMGLEAVGVDIDPDMIAACNPPQEALL